MERCFAANVSGANSRFLGFMGNIIEIVVVHDYIIHRVNVGGTVDIFPSPSARDFFDLQDDRCEALAAFMKLRNPSVNETLIRDFCRQRKVRDGDKSMVPDIITHDGARKEFYEIKSASPTGRADGNQKVRNFDELRSGMQTAYQPGTIYDPHFKQVFWTGTWQGVPARVSLQFERDSDALILYKYCVEVNAATVSEAIMFLVLRAAIAAVILTRNPALAVAVAAGVALLLTPVPRSPLLQSVGNGQPNTQPDTQYVQVLLNDFRGKAGDPLLKVDGAFGPKTRAAIIQFQQAVTGQVDGRVDPNGPAITSMERLHLDGLPAGVPSDFLPPQDSSQLLDDADLALFIAAPGNADEPGGGDLTPVDLLQIVRLDVQDYFQALHDNPFDLVP
jgi:putative peptidoglycan binding protein